MELAEVAERFESLHDEVAKVVVGQDELVEGVIIALFAEGSVLIEGVPGLGKTLLANTLARAVSCEFKRVQFTPDLMPSDITGHNVFNVNDGRFDFNRGPVFTNLLLADEINRSPPKSQSALLEVMQERQVTVDGTVYPLTPPFLVLGTQNPIEHEGTYPLPEAQVDRFLFKLMVDYPSQAHENEILQQLADGRDWRGATAAAVRPVLTGADVIAIQRAVGAVRVEPAVINYITSIVQKTREDPAVYVGASPRGSIGLFVASRTAAACSGRDFVTPDDVKRIAPWVLRHRLMLKPESVIEGLDADTVVHQILATVEVPRA